MGILKRSQSEVKMERKSPITQTENRGNSFIITMNEVEDRLLGKWEKLEYTANFPLETLKWQEPGKGIKSSKYYTF